MNIIEIKELKLETEQIIQHAIKMLEEKTKCEVKAIKTTPADGGFDDSLKIIEITLEV